MSDVILQYVDVDGSVVDLNNLVSTWMVKGGRNLFNAPFGFKTFEVPLVAGEVVTSVDVQPRIIDIPVLVTESTRQQFIETMRALVTAMNPQRGEGFLRYGHEHNSTRELKCRYVGGLEGDGNGKGWSPSTGVVILSFRASDPFWYSAGWEGQQFTLSTPVTFFPFFPLRLTQTDVFSTADIVNSGDAEAYPVWTITGPTSGVVLKNVTTDEELSLSISLGSGVSLVIDTRPGIKSVTSSGENYFYTLSSTSVLWSLQRGMNSLQVEMTGADANSLVDLQYRVPWLSC